jgi:CheY-like chemotaxis protein/HPt (histidine-containing phosphotransfer) domain-containing protein
MTESTIKTLFTPFKQAEKSTLRKFGGTGLGLSICYKLVNLMGGKINVTSTVGEGSKFYCDLPFSLAKLIPAELQQANYANISVVYNHQQNEKCAKSISLITSLENNGIRIVNHDALPVDEMDDINLALIICRTEADIIQVNRLVYGCPEALPVVICSHYPINLFSKITQKRSTFLLFDNLTVNKLTATITQKIATSSATKSLDEVDLDEKLSLDERLSLDEKLSFDEKLIFDDDFTLISDIKNAAPELNARLLVVEDNPVNQKLIAKQLQKLNLTFLMASNGFEGLAYWQTYSPKLILTDCHMPEMNGFDMSREIRKREKMQLSNKTRVSIIAITGATLTGDEQLCIEAGMDDFLSKPIQLKTLKNMLNKWIPNELPILSHNVLIDFIGNDKNSINEFYIEFMQQADTSMKFLTMHFNARNFEKISEEAHFLKTSAMAIGAQRTGQILHILEDKAREKSTKECYRELVALKTTLIALKSSIANHLNQA